MKPERTVQQLRTVEDEDEFDEEEEEDEGDWEFADAFDSFEQMPSTDAGLVISLCEQGELSVWLPKSKIEVIHSGSDKFLSRPEPIGRDCVCLWRFHL